MNATDMTDATPLTGLRVLVAEDEALIAMLLEDMLEELGAEVLGPVNSSSEAFRLIDAGPPDAATLDVNLRGDTVYGPALELHRRGVPLVFVSGYGDLPDCPEELAGAVRLKKPFRLDELAAALAQAIRQSTG